MCIEDGCVIGVESSGVLRFGCGVIRVLCSHRHHPPPWGWVV